MRHARYAWYEEPSLAYGTESDVQATRRVFADVAEAMQRARPATLEFNEEDSDMWQGMVADMVRGEMSEVPDFLGRFHQANWDVAEALRVFGPMLTSYSTENDRFRHQGRQTHREIVSVEQQLDQLLQRLSSEDFGNFDLIGGAYGLLTQYGDDPEVRRLRAQLEQLERDFSSAYQNWERNGDEFEASAESVAAAIRDAEDVLYNNDWDKFWSQTAAPIIEIVKVVVEIASVLVMIAVVMGSAGTLAPLVLGVLLLVINAAEVAGTMASGREVTGEMWFDLGMSAVGVLTAGMSRYGQQFVKSTRLASSKHAANAKKILKGKEGFTNAQRASVELERARQLSVRIDRFEAAKTGLERLEGGVAVAEGGAMFGEGLVEGNGWKVAGGLVSGASGTFDTSGLNVRGVDYIGEGSDIGHGTVGAIDSISEMTGGDAGSESPKDWPGLRGGTDAR